MDREPLFTAKSWREVWDRVAETDQLADHLLSSDYATDKQKAYWAERHVTDRANTYEHAWIDGVLHVYGEV